MCRVRVGIRDLGTMIEVSGSESGACVLIGGNFDSQTLYLFTHTPHPGPPFGASPLPASGIVLPKISTAGSPSYGGITAAFGTCRPKVLLAAAARSRSAVAPDPTRSILRLSAHSRRCAECEWHAAAHLLRHFPKHRPPSAALIFSCPASEVVAVAAVAHRDAHRWTHPVEQSRAFGAVLVAQSSPA